MNETLRLRYQVSQLSQCVDDLQIQRKREPVLAYLLVGVVIGWLLK